jgi:flagellar L-ring protein precursor FlgH
MKKYLSVFIAVSAMVTVGMAQIPAGDMPSIYSDIKAYSLGDIVTVVIIESTDASRESSANSSGSSSTGAQGSVTGTLTNFLPVFGMSSSVNTNHDNDEGTSQTETMTGKISATIVEKMENGTLRIRGERLMEVNGETNLMQIEGIVRPRDIGNDNIVYSYNVADAKVVYRKDGLKNQVFKPGAIHRWGNWILGIGLVGLAVAGVSL